MPGLSSGSMIRETSASLLQTEGQEPGGEPTAGVCWPEARRRDNDGQQYNQVPDKGAVVQVEK